MTITNDGFSSKDRIVVVTSSHDQIDDGRVFHRCSKTLAENGYNVIQIGPYGEGYADEKEGVLVRGFKPRPDIYHFNIFQRFKNLHLILRMMLKFPARVYHCHEIDVVAISLIISFFRGSRTIFDCHEHTRVLFVETHYRNQLGKKVVSGLIWFVERALSRLCYAVIIPDKAVESIFKNFGVKNTIISPNFPPINTRCGKSLANETVQGQLGIFIGSISKDRGIIPLLEALRKVLNQDIDLKLKLVGFVEDDFAPILTQVVEELKLKDAVIFIDRVPYSELWDHLGSADFGVVLDPPLEHNLHSVANKFYEYLSAGLPVIGSNLPKMSEIYKVNNFGILIEPENPESITNGIVDLLGRSKEDLLKMGEENRNIFVKNYSWDSVEHRLINLYSSIFSSFVSTSHYIF